MSRACHPTADELRATFVRLLASGGDQGMPTCTGLDPDTRAAIQRACNTPTQRAAARQAFAAQLDGTHARQAHQARWPW